MCQERTIMESAEQLPVSLEVYAFSHSSFVKIRTAESIVRSLGPSVIQ